jgi:cytochrome b pre-mRNA-processing protein 3
MKNNYIDIYNKFVFLTRNKDFYKDLKEQDTFSDRLTILLFHFGFFLKTFKNKENKTKLQEIYDFIFRQLELSIREIGYGDQTINKKMKDYINLFYAMLDELHDWENYSDDVKCSIFSSFTNNEISKRFLVDYFEKYRKNLQNNTFNFYLKGVVNQ